MKHVTELFFLSCWHKTVRKQSISERGEILYDKQGALPRRQIQTVHFTSKKCCWHVNVEQIKILSPFSPVEIHGLLAPDMYILKHGSLIPKLKSV